MSKPTGKLAMAYSTIATMEARIKELECQQAAGVAVQDSVEVCAFLMEPDLYEPYVSLSRDSKCNGSVEPLMTVSQHKRIVSMLAAAPHPVSGEQKAIEMADIVNALESVPGAPILTSNMCYAIAQAINAHRAQQGGTPS